MARTITADHTYLDRLVQLIPAEIIAAHLAVQDLVVNQILVRERALEVSAGFLFVLIPFYLWFAHEVRSKLQIALTMGSFVIWVMAVSLPFYQRPGLDPVWGSVALILWTTAIPAIPMEDGT